MRKARQAASDDGINPRVLAAFNAAWEKAEKLVAEQELTAYATASLSKDIAEKALALGEIRHGGRGIALTLAAAKIVLPEQDIRAFKRNHPNGFDARGIDEKITVPFLNARKLYANRQSHWMTRIFAGDPYRKDHPLPTQPPESGRLMVELVSAMQEEPKNAPADAMLCVLLGKMLEERNSSATNLTRPKNLTIQSALEILDKHLNYKFKVPRNAGPRLAQLVMYALYQCLIPASARYDGWELGPLERLKAANRKSGTVGDIDVLHRRSPIEAVEVKFGSPVKLEHVNIAIEKVQSKEVRRYYILSTVGVDPDEADAIAERCRAFFIAYGCEIIANGVLDTVKYYLRILVSTDEFITKYVELVEKDQDLTYEHKNTWNLITKNALETHSGK